MPSFCNISVTKPISPLYRRNLLKDLFILLQCFYVTSIFLKKKLHENFCVPLFFIFFKVSRKGTYIGIIMKQPPFLLYLIKT